MMAASSLKIRIVDEARRWLKTPYKHQCAMRGQGADCLGLLIGVYTEIIGRPPEAAPPYSADWSEAGGDEMLLRAAHKYLLPLSLNEAVAGDVLIFRFSSHAVAKHCAIITRSGRDARMIHAVSGREVMETAIGGWRHKIAAAF